MVSGSSRWLPLTDTETIWRCGAGAGGCALAGGATAGGAACCAAAGKAPAPSTVPTSNAAQYVRPLGKTLFAVTRPRLHFTVGASPGPNIPCTRPSLPDPGQPI